MLTAVILPDGVLLLKNSVEIFLLEDIFAPQIPFYPCGMQIFPSLNSGLSFRV